MQPYGTIHTDIKGHSAHIHPMGPMYHVTEAQFTVPPPLSRPQNRIAESGNGPEIGLECSFTMPAFHHGYKTILGPDPIAMYPGPIMYHITGPGYHGEWADFRA